MKGDVMPFAATTAGRVFYEERGSGVPVVLLHATLHDHRDFDLVAGPMAARYRTIAVDWPGHGQSDPPVLGRPVDAFRCAAVLADVVESLDLAPAVLIGNSVGGFAAARLALDQPDRVAGLILVNTAGFTAQNAASRLSSRLLGSPRVSRRLLPRLVAGYMKPRNSHDRAIAAGAGPGAYKGRRPHCREPLAELRNARLRPAHRRPPPHGTDVAGVGRSGHYLAGQGRSADARRDTGIAIPGVRDRARRFRLGPGRIPGPGRAIHRVRERGPPPRPRRRASPVTAAIWILPVLKGAETR
jgi:pimeloyl-ACP methyl ester carboxylesterase